MGNKRWSPRRPPDVNDVPAVLGRGGFIGKPGSTGGRLARAAAQYRAARRKAADDAETIAAVQKATGRPRSRRGGGGGAL